MNNNSVSLKEREHVIRKYSLNVDLVKSEHRKKSSMSFLCFIRTFTTSKSVNTVLNPDHTQSGN